MSYFAMFCQLYAESLFLENTSVDALPKNPLVAAHVPRPHHLLNMNNNPIDTGLFVYLKKKKIFA